MVRFVKRLKLMSAPNGKVNRTPEGTFIVPNGGGIGSAPSTPGTLDPFIISSIKGDYLICTPRGGGATVNIAKSPCLWQSVTSATIEGVAITYTSTPYVGAAGEFSRRDAIAQGITVKEEVTPPYLVGQPIYAMKVTGGTGAVVPGGGTVEYVSVSDPRAWATRADQST